MGVVLCLQPQIFTIWACCLQDLAFVLIQALFQPCLMSAQEEGQPAELPGYPHVGFMPLGRHLTRYHLLSMMPSVIKGTDSGLWFWQNAMPLCPGWLEDYIDWMVDKGNGATIDIGPYLAVFGKHRHAHHKTSTGPCTTCEYWLMPMQWLPASSQAACVQLMTSMLVVTLSRLVCQVWLAVCASLLDHANPPNDFDDLQSLSE